MRSPSTLPAPQPHLVEPNTILQVMAATRIYLHIPQANPTAQQALQEFRRRQPLHLWIDDGLVDKTLRFWVSYEPPFDEQEAGARTREIFGQIEADGIDLAGIRIAE